MLLLMPLSMLLVPVVIGSLLPWRYSGFLYGCIALLCGLALLDLRNVPIEDRDSIDAMLGQFFVVAWVVLAGAAYLIRLLVRSWRSEGVQPPRPLETHERILAWPLPIGALFAVSFIHWLSNRLAGAGPAWAIHLAVPAVAALAALLVFRAKWLRSFPDARTLALVFLAGAGLVVAKAAIDARQWSALARTAAAGRPYCLLTFAGRENVREAKHVLELSPLVSRSGGRSFAEDVPFFIVNEAGMPRAKGWRNSRGGGYVTDAPANLPFACTPRIGGSIA